MATYNDRNQLLISSASRITGASVSIKNSFGNQLLVPKNSAVPYPQNITLTAVASKYLNPQYSWFYKIGTGEYFNLNLSTSVITLNLDADWLSAVGANTTVTYKVQVTETSGTLGINATEAEFVVPVLREGTDGTSAWNNIIVRIYRRSTTNAAPSIDRSASQTSTYTFSNGSLVGAPLGWSTSIPETGGDYIFVSEYSAVSQLSSVQFTNDNWSVPVLYVKSGNVGSSGIVVFAYKRSATALLSTDKPTNPVTYSFATNTITTEDLGGGWSKSIPTGTDTLYIVAATASSSTETDTIPTTEWSSPVEFVRNGANGTSPVVGLLTNESATVAAANDGTVSSFAGTGGVFKVFEGLTDKTGSGVTYSVVAGTASGVTISIDATGTYTVSAMSVDTGTATLRAVYAGVIVDKVYSIAKSKAGASGSAAITAILSNENHVFTADSAGAIAAGSYGGSGTQVRVYEGSTELTYDAVGTANGTWKVTASATSITAGAITDSGVYATVGNASGMSSLSNTAIITYTITGRSLTGTNFSIVKTQTFSKSKAGLNGTSPIIYEIVLSAPVITKDSKDAATAGSYSSVTIQGTYTTGSTTINYGFITVTADNDAEETTAINTAVEPYLLAPATTANTSKYTVKLYDAATVATATLLDTQVINVVFKGADGAPSKYVNLTTTAQAFAYNSEGATPNPVTATFTATAYNTTGTVYYEFLVGATSKANTTTNTYTYTPQSAYSSMPEQITVKVREGSTTGTVVATDTMSVIGIKPGAAGNTVAVPYLYARNNSVSSAPAFTTTDLTTLTFTFASGALTGTPPTNWYKEPPDVSTGSVLWVRTAVAFSSDATYSIPWASWGDAKVLSTSGVRGSRNLYSNNAAYTSDYQPNPNLTAGLENYREKATTLIADATSGSIPTTPIKGDTVTFTNGSTYVFTLTYDGSAWNAPGTVIDGSLLVTGSVTAAKINSTGLTIRNAAGQVVFGAGTGQDSVNLDSQYISPASGWLNSNITIGGSNLVKGTGSGIGWTDYSFFFGNNANAFWKTNNTSSENYFYSPYFTLSGGREITISFEAYNTTSVDSTEVLILPDDYASTGLLTWGYGKYSSYTKVSKTFTTPAAWGTDKQVRLRFDNNGSTGGNSIIYVRNIKVEYGNKATDWSLHADEVNNRNITVDASGVLQGAGTSNITVNNQLVESTKLIASGNVTVSGTSIISSTAPGTWGSAQVYSSEGYAGGAYASFTVKADGVARHFMAGLNTASDLVDGGYASLDFAFYFEGVNLLTIYESGNWIGNFGTYADGDTFAVVYDGFQIFYYKNGSVVRTKTQTVTQKLFFDSAIATASSTPLLTNIKFSPLPSTSTAKNFADTSWWTWRDVNSSITTQYGVQWIPNSGTNKITTSRDALINQPSPLAGVSSDFVWYLTEPDSSNNAGGGWDANLNHTLDPTKTYRFVVPVMRLSGGEISGQVYWGTYDVCDLNTTNTNTNPYFCNAPRSSLVENRWYLMVGYVFPYGSTNNTHEGAGLIDTTTGLYVVGGTNWAHTSIGASIHRAYQYYASAGNRQVFGRPEIYEVNGTEPPLSRYMTLAKTMNASISVDSNGVLKNAGNEALVGNSAIALSISNTGTLSATGGPSTAGAVTIRGLGFVGDLGATSGKSLSPPLSNWNLNGTNTLETISDGKVGNQAVRLNIAGNIINAPVYVPLDRSKIYRTRFWARPVNTNGLLKFALRQFKNTDGTTGDTNSGLSPYKPDGVSQAIHNSVYGTGQWGEYTYTWSSADWQTGVYFLLPTFLWNYTGDTGYWEIQDFTFEEVTEVVTAQAGINDKLSKSGESVLSGVVTMDTNYGSGFRAGNITWNSSGVVTSAVPGVAMTPRGIVSHNGTRTTFSLDSSTGDATFGGVAQSADGKFVIDFTNKFISITI